MSIYQGIDGEKLYTEVEMQEEREEVNKSQAEIKKLREAINNAYTQLHGIDKAVNIRNAKKILEEALKKDGE